MSFPEPEHPTPDKLEKDEAAPEQEEPQPGTQQEPPPQPRPVNPIILTADKPAEKIKEITDRLEQGITDLFDSERYKEYLQVMSKFHNYSFNNTLLIAMQKPDASLIAGFNAWKNNFGRNVMRGEKGIRILAPSPYKIRQEVEKKDPQTGKTVLAGGWKDLERRYRATLKGKPDPEDADSDGENTLPELSEGQSFESPTAKVTEHFTTPPKPHNEATLLSAMERAGNEDTDPDAERRGLGTPATRAAVIEKLVKSGFAERKGKQLIPTQNGAALVSVLPDMLTSPQLTAEWENNLTQIAKGAADPGEFLSGIEAMARELVQTHAAALDGKKDLFREEKPSVGKCPRCGSPVHEGKKNYYCSNKECAFVMWKNDRFFEERKTAFSAKIAAALLKSGKANVKKLYSPKTGKTYDGIIVLADTGGKYVNYRIEVRKN